MRKFRTITVGSSQNTVVFVEARRVVPLLFEAGKVENPACRMTEGVCTATAAEMDVRFYHAASQLTPTKKTYEKSSKRRTQHTWSRG